MMAPLILAMVVAAKHPVAELPPVHTHTPAPLSRLFVNLTMQEFGGYAAGVGVGYKPYPHGPIFNLNLLHGAVDGVDQSLRLCGFRNCPTCRVFDTSTGSRSETGVQFMVQIPVK